MVSSKSVKFPLPLGKTKKNTIESQGSKITAGRWINNEEDLENPPTWVKVQSEGYLIDRSISDISYSSSNDEFALITRYTDPKSLQPMIELLPVNSSAFDMENEPDGIDSCYAFDTDEDSEQGIFQFPSIAVGLGMISYLMKNRLEGENNEE
jgi:hypothetical protein|tara:strand:+ start:1619 stop:2074 length:456 start_codon:yes stop_codon:yes gene_type:complete